MVIRSTEVKPGVFQLVSDQKTADGADRDFIDWAAFRQCYTPTASEMEEDEQGRWTILVMKEPQSPE